MNDLLKKVLSREIGYYDIRHLRLDGAELEEFEQAVRASALTEATADLKKAYHCEKHPKATQYFICALCQDEREEKKMVEHWSVEAVKCIQANVIPMNVQTALAWALAEGTPTILWNIAQTEGWMRCDAPRKFSDEDIEKIAFFGWCQGHFWGDRIEEAPLRNDWEKLSHKKDYLEATKKMLSFVWESRR